MKRFLFLILVSAVHGSYAVEPGITAPVYIANQNPFVQIFGLPKSESGKLVSKGTLNAGFLYYVSNSAIDWNGPNGEMFIWDGEVAQYTARFRYGAADWLEVGMDIPVVDHSGGYLDSIIRKTHQLWGMPNDRQDAFDKNQLHYKYLENGVDYDNTERQTGLGDIRVSAAVPVYNNKADTRNLALRSILKFPTGDSDGLLGSGGTDLSLGLAFSDRQSLEGINSFYHLSAGMLYLGESDLFSSQQNSFAGYGGASIGWAPYKVLSFKAQLDVHSALYDSVFDQLGSSIQLVVGGTAKLPGNILLDLGMSQNMVTDATPDVGFYLFLYHGF